ncbi:MAG: hypothetical protein ACOYMQ_11675, partial [Pseudanabaena sp.]
MRGKAPHRYFLMGKGVWHFLGECIQCLSVGRSSISQNQILPFSSNTFGESYIRHNYYDLVILLGVLPHFRQVIFCFLLLPI